MVKKLFQIKINILIEKKNNEKNVYKSQTISKYAMLLKPETGVFSGYVYLAKIFIRQKSKLKRKDCKSLTKITGRNICNNF